MSQDDNNLSKLLKQWRDIEPASNFEASVRRRIRRAQTGPPARVPVVEQWLRRWLWNPALGLAAAVVVSAVIGASAGIHTALRQPAGPGEMQFMSAGTLAGGYARLALEGTR